MTRPSPDTEHAFADTIRILGRGPGRSRALTRAEAQAALGMVLRGETDPHQTGAFLMLLRYRGEDAAEIAGLTEAARAAMVRGPGVPAPGVPVDLDWPSYGAGRTRGAPWFLLAALALAQSGVRVLMHGSNEFSGGTAVSSALPELGLRPAASRQDAAGLLDRTGFAYLPLPVLVPELDRLLRLRALLGLRSPINTVCRLLDPFGAGAGVDGVFHPPYIALHLAAAALLERPRLAVVKGGGGEAERNPAKPVAVHLHRRGMAPEEVLFPPLAAPGEPGPESLRAAWQNRTAPPGPGALTAIATIALALLALGRADGMEAAERMAGEVWRNRQELPEPGPGRQFETGAEP